MHPFLVFTSLEEKLFDILALYRTTLLTILHDWMPYILSYTEQSLLRRCLVPLFIDIV